MIVKVNSVQKTVQEVKVNLATERMVDSATVTFKPSENVERGDDVVIYDNTGTTKIFGGIITALDKTNVHKATVMGYGYQLNNTHVLQVYENKSPEYIVEDLITNHSNLTYSSTATSGITLEKFIANDFLNKIIFDMCNLLGWQFRTDPDKKAYFEPLGEIDNGVTLTTGTDIKIKTWEFWEPEFNDVKIKGDYAEYQNTETFSGDGSTTEFTLTYKPVGNLKVTVGGTEQTPGAEGKGDYYVYREEKKIVFTTAPTSGTDNISVEYSYQIPIVVESKNEESIATYQVKYKEIDAPFIKTFADARAYAKELLDVYGDGTVKATVEKPGIDTSLTQGELITLSDPQRNITEEVTIREIEYKYPKNVTILKVGSHDYVVYDWQREVQERIKQLEKKLTNEELIMNHRLFKHNLNVSMTLTYTDKYRNIYDGSYDTFILGHPTNGKLGVQTGVGGTSVVLGDHKGNWINIT